MRVRAGDESGEATMGLLTTDRRGRVFCLTSSAVAAPGTTPSVRLPSQWRRLGEVHPITRGDRVPPICRLLALVELDLELQASAVVPGVGNVRRLIATDKLFDARLQLATSPPEPVGDVVAIDSTALVRHRGAQAAVAYDGAIALERRGPLRLGTAGAAVMTRKGTIAGLVVAASSTRIFVAPLADLFASRELAFLDSYSATAHNARVLARLGSEVDGQKKMAAGSAEAAEVRETPVTREVLRSDRLFAEVRLEERFSEPEAEEAL
jgi:hypothetical protein